MNHVRVWTVLPVGPVNRKSPCLCLVIACLLLAPSEVFAAQKTLGDVGRLQGFSRIAPTSLSSARGRPVSLLHVSSSISTGLRLWS